MKIRTIIPPQSFPFTIDHRDQVLCIGSCFAGTMGVRLQRAKIPVAINHFGIGYNPVSLSLQYSGEPVDDSRFVTRDDRVHHLDYHSDLRAVSIEEWYHQYHGINRAAAEAVRSASVLLLTLGTSIVYRSAGQVVANCHKQDPRLFVKEMLSLQECILAIQSLIQLLQPGCHVIITLSPVRHAKEGLVQNSRSKARLLEAIHTVVDQSDRVVYFPAYEMMMDDLRDYRYYSDDLLHPSAVAIEYIWQTFLEGFFAVESRALLAEIESVRLAKEHRPYQSTSTAHQSFCKATLQRIEAILLRYPTLDFTSEIAYFKKHML